MIGETANEKSKQVKLDDSRIKEAEQELEKEKLEVLRRQEEERSSALENMSVEEINQQGQMTGTGGEPDSPGTASDTQ